MGKSYKKHPVCRGGYGKKGGKKRANKKLRHKKDIGNGNEYRKHTERWDFRDFESRLTEDDAARLFYNPSSHIREQFKDFDEWMNYWKRCYKRK